MEDETITIKKSANHGIRGRGKITRSIKEQIEKAFHKQVKNGWLDRLAKSDPAVFAGLVKAIIPSEVNAHLQHDINMQVNIGQAMAEANARLAKREDLKVIDVEYDDGTTMNIGEMVKK